MDKDKLIEKLKEARIKLSQYKEPYNRHIGVGLYDYELDLILTSLTAPVDGKECEEIVKELAEWSRKYPRGMIHSMSIKDKMDGELIALEERAKELFLLTPKTPDAG